MKYPIGIQNFGEVRTGGYAYVDKTAILYRLVDQGKYYFLSRPRRFGKSLFLSTLRAYFEGRRELFEGLAIAELEKEWKSYPVLFLDLNAEKYDEPGALDSLLNESLLQWEKVYGHESYEQTLSSRFRGIMRRAAQQTGRRVVILVDEYDKPLLQAIDNPAVQEDYRSTLKAFYGNLKNCDEYIQFAFLTGVTKFGKVSVFSDLNHLTDISLLPQYVDICGITELELRRNFDAGVAELAAANGMTKEECYARLKHDYDGYHFQPHTEGIYNPFSLLNTLAYRVFKDYWFETGTPTILVRQLQKTDFNLENLTREELTADTLNCIDVMNTNPLPLIFQSGYLTIRDYDPMFRVYMLGFPNREVEEGFIQFLSAYYLPHEKGTGNFSIRKFVLAVLKGDVEDFLRRLAALFADGNYQIVGDEEIYFHNMVYVFFKLMGFHIDVERHTTDGRMDILMQTPEYIYIIELKRDQTAAAALQQIEDKHYAAPFAADPRRVFCIGINFDTARRTINDWAYKIEK